MWGKITRITLYYLKIYCLKILTPPLGGVGIILDFIDEEIGTSRTYFIYKIHTFNVFLTLYTAVLTPTSNDLLGLALR